jgi:hypothetical protein
MKVFNLPEECPMPKVNFGDGFDYNKMVEAETDHAATLAEWLRGQGYTGEHTGKILRMPFADGHAQYMFADAKRGSCLIHLPYGDGWHDPNAKFLPKGEVIKRVKQQDRIAEMFAARA